MQIQEAQVILDVVVKGLHVKKVWCASIHDSIICRPGNQEEVAALILDAFQGYSVQPSLEVEPLRKPQTVCLTASIIAECDSSIGGPHPERQSRQSAPDLACQT